MKSMVFGPTFDFDQISGQFFPRIYDSIQHSKYTKTENNDKLHDIWQKFGFTIVSYEHKGNQKQKICLAWFGSVTQDSVCRAT